MGGAVSKIDIQSAINSKLLSNGVMNLAIVADVEAYLGITGVGMYSITKMDATFPHSGKSCPDSTPGNADASFTPTISVQTGLLIAALAFGLQASLLSN